MSGPVSWNWRVRRKDGRPISQREALAAVRYLAHNLDDPPSYIIEVVNWRARRGTVYPSSGADGAAAKAAFLNIMYVDEAAGLFPHKLRAGSVKRI